MRKSLFALACLALLPIGANAAVNATLNWNNPTVGCSLSGGQPVSPCDNVPLTGVNALTEIQVFTDTKPITGTTSTSLTPTSLAPGVTTVTVAKTVAAGSTLYFRVRACNGAPGHLACSNLSNEASKVIPAGLDVKPGAPTSLQVVITIAQLNRAEMDALLSGGAPPEPSVF